MTKKKITTVTTITEEIVENELTEIVCVLDRSGSMSGIITDMIGGFNTFIEDQKKEQGECNLTVALFDDRYELLYDNVDIKKVKPITRAEWSPRGSTALYDAIGKTINDVENRYVKTEKRPDKVLVCIVTDGEENSSKEFRIEAIKKLIGEKEKEKWSFLYLAANQDAFSVGDGFGISRGNTINFMASAQGSQFVNSSLSNASSYVRGVTADKLYSSNMSANIIDFSSNSDTTNVINNVTGDVNNPNKIIQTTQTGTYEPEGDISGGTIPTLDYTKDK